MNFNELLTYDVIIAAAIFVVCIILIIYFKSTDNSNKNENLTNVSQEENVIVNDDLVKKKKLYYFGGHHCPHSNTQSHMYRFLTQKLVSQHPNIDLVIFWGSDPNSQVMFEKHNVEFVPTVVNENGVKVDVKIPDGTNIEGKNNEEIENIVIENLVNQL